MAQQFSNILIYEDSVARSRRFLPLTYTRCVAELRSGAATGIERIRASFPDSKIFLHVRPELKNVVALRHKLPVNEVPVGATLVINAREALSPHADNDWQVFETLPSEISARLISGEPIVPPSPVRDNSPDSLWQIITANSKIISGDIEHHIKVLIEKRGPADLPGVNSMNPSEIFLARDARIDPGVVLDASNGPILIGHRTHVMPNSTIIGPVAIAPDCIVKAGAKIYGGTSVGPVSKIGGEIENSIVQSYSNKQHDGYLGHSFIGEWANLGAGTNTSDLKNNYSSVRVTIEGEEFDTGSLFVGLLMGDHSKSGIGTQFNTGTVVGVSCNIFDAGFPPKWIPNFSWGGAPGITNYRYEKAIEVARAVCARRNIVISAEEEELLRRLFVEKNLIEV